MPLYISCVCANQLNITYKLYYVYKSDQLKETLMFASAWLTMFNIPKHVLRLKYIKERTKIEFGIQMPTLSIIG